MITDISYNARYAKLREVKNAHFPDFWHFCLGWLIFRFGSTDLRILHFLSYFIVLFVSRLQMLPVLCAAAVVHLFLCGHYFARFYQIVSMDVPTYMMLTAYNANYKDP